MVMKHDEAEIAWSVSHVMEPELRYLVGLFGEYFGGNSLDDFLFFLDLLRDNFN